jgi:hypothetical protein
MIFRVTPNGIDTRIVGAERGDLQAEGRASIGADCGLGWHGAASKGGLSSEQDVRSNRLSGFNVPAAKQIKVAADGDGYEHRN